MINLKTLIAAAVISISITDMPICGQTILKTTIDPVTLILDGRKADGGWRLIPGPKTDVLDTTAKNITFATDTDTLNITLDEWQSKDFIILTAKGDTARVRVNRKAANPYENPDPALLKKAPSGLLSRKQAEFDINALVYSLSQIHPDIFSTCRQADFFRAVNTAIASLPDSVSVMELYHRTAPIVAMIGDGHTNLTFPYSKVFTKELKRMPLWVDVLSDKSIVCRSSLDSIIPRGAKILSINGHTDTEMIDAMMPFVAGEREHFKLSRIDSSFPALRHMLFPADTFEISYLPEGAKKPLSVTYQAISFDEAKRRSPTLPESGSDNPYSFTIDKKNNVAIMDFREFSDVGRMESFADSMFTALRKNKIGNLIIDLRKNGGGNSSVGDRLLRYITPEPYMQMDKALVKITPLTKKLMKAPDIVPTFMFWEATPDQYIVPRTADEGHYDGNVYLLTSNKTFSSAGSFAWAFKECGMGTVIGEETGGMNVCFGDVLTYRMPVSRLQCSVSFKRFWQFRADENDIHGTIPDIAVPAAKAMDTALKLAKKSK